MPRIKLSVAYIESLLKDLFVKDKILIERLFAYTEIFVTLMFIMHISTCGWIVVGEYEWMTPEQITTLDHNTLYMDGIYFMTTTMTAVGYGDYNAGGLQISMLYLIAIQFFGILAFSLIKESVFGAK